MTRYCEKCRKNKDCRTLCYFAERFVRTGSKRRIEALFEDTDAIKARDYKDVLTEANQGITFEHIMALKDERLRAICALIRVGFKPRQIPQVAKKLSKSPQRIYQLIKA